MHSHLDLLESRFSRDRMAWAVLSVTKWRDLKPSFTKLRSFTCCKAVLCALSCPVMFCFFFPLGVKGNVQGNLFKIITKKDIHYYIQASSKAERTQWIEAIKPLTWTSWTPCRTISHLWPSFLLSLSGSDGGWFFLFVCLFLFFP